jgi:dolichyl-diphosphooligosaccharide--protein glycosyltransferase
MDHYRLVHMDNVSALQGGEAAAFRRDIRQSGVSNEIRAQLGPNATQGDLQRRAINTLYRTTPAWTKTFERVPGATVEGTGPEDATLQLSVQMRPTNGSPFRYTKRVETDGSGAFSTTVPYSTTGYDAVGPAEGYTNTSVRAVGPYTISTGLQANESGALVQWRGTVNVTERQVVGADDSPAVADVGKRVLSPPQDNGTAEDSSETNVTSGNETDAGSEANSTAGADDSTGGMETDTGSESGTDGASNTTESQSRSAPGTVAIRP